MQRVSAYIPSACTSVLSLCWFCFVPHPLRCLFLLIRKGVLTFLNVPANAMPSFTFSVSYM